jgi:hypothetical protein
MHRVDFLHDSPNTTHNNCVGFNVVRSSDLFVKKLASTGNILASAHFHFIDKSKYKKFESRGLAGKALLCPIQEE